jgi:hypothetical protein
MVQGNAKELLVQAVATRALGGDLPASPRSHSRGASDDLDLKRGTVTVSRKFGERQDGRRVTGPPKSTGGVRAVALPAMIVDVMKAHLVEFSAGRNELVLRAAGSVARAQQLPRSVHWSKIVVEAGLPAGVHFHDLRHTEEGSH